MIGGVAANSDSHRGGRERDEEEVFLKGIKIGYLEGRASARYPTETTGNPAITAELLSPFSFQIYDRTGSINRSGMDARGVTLIRP